MVGGGGNAPSLGLSPGGGEIGVRRVFSPGGGEIGMVSLFFLGGREIGVLGVGCWALTPTLSQDGSLMHDTFSDKY